MSAPSPAKPVTVRLEEPSEPVSGLWLRPPGARAALVLAHGAGAGMQHAFMEAAATELAAHGIATLRFQFPYMEAGSRRPDHRRKLVATIRAAVAKGAELAEGLPLFAGGKSMGGRMTSLAASEAPLEGVRGIVFLGFPLHPAGKPGVERAEHLFESALPLLFLQGTRDKLADLALLEPICVRLGGRATLHVVDGADHSFHVLKRSGRTDEEVLGELASEVETFVAARGD
ncbi:MAG: alpha/beta hydrolase [Myxococcota bacterium]|nr:alpha/beta hydrolase [Myxococcota bacterium]